MMTMMTTTMMMRMRMMGRRRKSEEERGGWLRRMRLFCLHLFGRAIDDAAWKPSRRLVPENTDTSQ
eukprot:7089652-Pyramimonas_sp.AAC.1